MTSKKITTNNKAVAFQAMLNNSLKSKAIHNIKKDNEVDSKEYFDLRNHTSIIYHKPEAEWTEHEKQVVEGRDKIDAQLKGLYHIAGVIRFCAAVEKSFPSLDIKQLAQLGSRIIVAVDHVDCEITDEEFYNVIDSAEEEDKGIIESFKEEDSHRLDEVSKIINEHTVEQNLALIEGDKDFMNGVKKLSNEMAEYWAFVNNTGHYSREELEKDPFIIEMRKADEEIIKRQQEREAAKLNNIS